MDVFDKKSLSETDIRTKYITPAIEKAGWNILTQVREEYPITKGRIIASRKPPTKSYATSRKVAYVALSALFKRTKNEKEFGYKAEFFFCL